MLIAASPQIPYMVEWFREMYDEADIVTGHYIRKFDLPILNAALVEWGHDPLSAKLTIDTKLDIISMAGLSQSQENLGAMLRLSRGKYHMNDVDWRRATRLTLGGQKRIRKRAEKDVLQHKQLRKKMGERGMLKAPVLWRP